MRFNCGPSWAEKKAMLSDWHPWFAWRPVRVGSHDCRWLETVERKGIYNSYCLMGNPWVWDYRALEK